jgi:cytochrome c-type biogenesis protein CcmE
VKTTMTPKQKQRFILVSLLVVGLGVGISLVLMALDENINLFFTPSQVVAGEVPPDQRFRIGGMVTEDSVEKLDGELTVLFKLNDSVKEVQLRYAGILPDLFREGQGIVAEGKLNEEGVFVADQVLAKHDENYMPPEVEHALKVSGGDYYNNEATE